MPFFFLKKTCICFRLNTEQIISANNLGKPNETTNIF